VNNVLNLALLVINLDRVHSSFVYKG